MWLDNDLFFGDKFLGYVGHAVTALNKENKNYYPIIMVKKENEDNKTMELTKTFNYKNVKYAIQITHFTFKDMLTAIFQ